MYHRNKTKIVIIGAGITGLGAAVRLQELGHSEHLIIESESEVGGLSRSFRDDAGFTWDLGGHINFSHYADYDRRLDAVLPGGWLWHNRESWIWLKGRFIPYPFQYNVHHLDGPEQQEILEDLRLAASRSNSGIDRNFETWIFDTFGAGIARLFMIPYNFKVWGYPAAEMSSVWIGERVSRPDFHRIEENIRLARDDISWGPNNRFRFPLEGGTGATCKAFARQIPPQHFRLNDPVVGIDPARRIVRLKSGNRLGYDIVLNTMPLDHCVGLCDGIAPQIRNAVTALRHSSVHVIGIGIRGNPPDSLRTKCWMYFPEDRSPYYRVTVFSNYSPHNVPPDGSHWSLMAEVCDSPHRPVEGAALPKAVIKSLQDDRLIRDPRAIISIWHRREEYAYPTPTLERDQALAAIHPVLESGRIFSRGRFGGWKYEVSNMDHSFMQGVEWVNWLVSGEPETTYKEPARINRNLS